jgi:hypothetical protein
MRIKLLQWAAVMCLAISMAGGWAHLMSMPAKMRMSREDYFVAQQVYQGWALLGIPIFAALGATAALALLQRHARGADCLSLAAALCIAASLVIFFIFTFPANQATQNWTTLPPDWEPLRRQWEYSHAAGAVLYFIAMGLLIASILSTRDR